MKRQKSPQEKKAIAYEKDRVYLAENRATFFKNFSLIKARASRAERHKVSQILSVARLTDEESQGDIPLKPVRRRRVRKYRSRPVRLGDAVLGQNTRRTERTAWRFFRHDYSSEKHRKAFAAFLTSLTEGQSGESLELASLFQDFLNPPPRGPDVDGRLLWKYNQVRHDWLTAFFQDEPDWEPRLRAWVDELCGPEDEC